MTIPITKTNQGGATTTDYSGVPSSVTFNSGDTEESFVFSATDDSEDDDDEGVVLGLGALPDRVSVGSVSTTIVSITDDDGAGVTVSRTSLDIEEGESDSYTVRLDSQPVGDVTVTIGGHSGTDLTLSTTTLSFGTGTWSAARTVRVTAREDEDSEDENPVTLTHTTVSSDPDYSGRTVGSVTVRVADNDDPAVSVSFESGSYTVTEGVTTTVTVTLSEDPERTVTIPLTATPEGGATTTDYSGVPSSVTFNSGDIEKSFVFIATDDSDDDDGESVLLTFGTLPNGVSEGSVSTTVISINDNDNAGISKVTLTLTPSTINESGVGNVSTVSAILSATSTVTTTVTVSVAPSSAVTLSGTTLTIAAGQTTSTGSVTITAVDDNDYNGDREVTVSGYAVNSNGVTHPDNVTLAITEDDDKPVSVSFEQASYTVSEGSGVTVTVTLDVPSGRTVTVPIDTTELNGISASDYSGVPSSVTFGASDTQKSFMFTAVDDSDDDDGESVELSFGSLSSGVSGRVPMVATVTISDNDSPIGMPMVTLRVTPSVIEEQGGGSGKHRHGDGVPGQDIRRRDHGDHLH